MLRGFVTGVVLGTLGVMMFDVTPCSRRVPPTAEAQTPPPCTCTVTAANFCEDYHGQLQGGAGSGNFHEVEQLTRVGTVVGTCLKLGPDTLTKYTPSPACKGLQAAKTAAFTKADWESFSGDNNITDQVQITWTASFSGQVRGFKVEDNKCDCAGPGAKVIEGAVWVYTSIESELPCGMDSFDFTKVAYARLTANDDCTAFGHSNNGTGTHLAQHQYNCLCQAEGERVKSEIRVMHTVTVTKNDVQAENVLKVQDSATNRNWLELDQVSETFSCAVVD